MDEEKYTGAPFVLWWALALCCSVIFGLGCWKVVELIGLFFDKLLNC